MKKGLDKIKMAATVDQTGSDQPNYGLLYDKEYHIKREYLFGNYLISAKKLSYRIIENGYFLPLKTRVNEGGIFTSGGDYVPGSSYREGVVFDDYINNRSITLKAAADLHGLKLSEAVFDSSPAVYLGRFFAGWGHFITDTMRLLWFLRTKDYAEKFSSYKLIYSPFGGFRLEGNYKRLLEILGIDCSKLIPVSQFSRYSRIILPDEAFFMDDTGLRFFTPDEAFFMDNAGLRFFTPEYVSMIDTLRDFSIANYRGPTSSKIYYSYSGYTSGKTFGEDKLEQYFASKGYEIVHPEKLTLDEQLNILAGCRSFATTAGSCAHNVIFLPDGAEVILIPRGYYIPSYQTALNCLHKLNVSYVDSSFSIFTEKTPWFGPHLYFVSSKLRKYFHDEDTTPLVDVSDFMKYMKRNPKADNLEAFRYYSSVAPEYFGRLFAVKRSMALRERLKRVPGLRKVVRAVKKILGLANDGA